MLVVLLLMSDLLAEGICKAVALEFRNLGCLGRSKIKNRVHRSWLPNARFVRDAFWPLSP
jgi:hypothetical protein